jgi:adenylate cyclase
MDELGHKVEESAALPRTAGGPAQDRQVLIGEVSAWLMEQALNGCELEGLLDGTFNRIAAAGLPVARANIGLTTLHPLFESLTFTWSPEGGLREERFTHGSGQSTPEWHRSPYYWLIEKSLPGMRRRLAGPEALLDFPLLADLAERGFTDYLAWLNPFDKQKVDGVVGSFTTTRAGGFTEGEIAALKLIQDALSVALKVVMREQLARNVLCAYLGEAAATRVLDGQIRRGDAQRIEAAIWYSDLRGSTELAESMRPSEFLATLDVYFEATAGAVMARGGQVLLLIGDAVLAIFPVEDGGPEAACRHALAAGHKALADVEALNRERAADGKPVLRFGLGLHLGGFLFGNIGTSERLEFTAVGPAVNAAARLEELSKGGDGPVIASREFATTAGEGEWRDLGPQRLRGLAEPVEVVALRLPSALQLAASD